MTLGFDWAELATNSVIVDVGGGVGSQTLTLAKTFDHLKFVVQDRPSVIEEAASKVSAAEIFIFNSSTDSDGIYSSGMTICLKQ